LQEAAGPPRKRGVPLVLWWDMEDRGIWQRGGRGWRTVAKSWHVASGPVGDQGGCW